MDKISWNPLQRKALKYLFISWNLSLSLFSWLGLIHVVPHLYGYVREHGYYSSICAPQPRGTQGANRACGSSSSSCSSFQSSWTLYSSSCRRSASFS